MTPSRPTEGGFTLIELLIVVVLLMLTFTTILAGLATSTNVSEMHRKQATAETLIRNLAEAVKRAEAIPYERCRLVVNDWETDPQAAGTPVELAFAAGHGLNAGDTVLVGGVGGGADGTWALGATGVPDRFTLVGSTGSGSYAAGGSAVRIPDPGGLLPAGAAQDFTAAITAVAHWNPLEPGAFGPCPAGGDSGLQRVTLDVRSVDRRVGETPLEVVRRGR